MQHAVSRFRKNFSLAGMAIGVALIVSGNLWGLLAKPKHFWTAEQADEFETARQIMHELTYDQPGAPAARDNFEEAREAEMAAAKQRFEKIEADLAVAASRQQRTGVWLTRMGLAALVLFGLGYLASHGY